MMLKTLFVSQYRIILSLFCVLLLGYGCAGSQGSVKVLTPLEDKSVLTKYENLEINTSSSEETSLASYEKERICNLIKAKLRDKSSNCFAKIVQQCNDPSTLKLNVFITRYDKGNAFARAMLAGLGQIHIDAEVTIEDKTTQSILSKHLIKKTFAWGGYTVAQHGLKM